MLRIHLFSIFTIKMSWTLAALGPLGVLITKKLTHVLNYHMTMRYILATMFL